MFRGVSVRREVTSLVLQPLKLQQVLPQVSPPPSHRKQSKVGTSFIDEVQRSRVKELWRFARRRILLYIK